MKKPAACLGCPFYGDGQGFVPDEIRENAPIFIYMQNPHHDEEAAGRPAVGRTGQAMESKFFLDAGIRREECSIGNTFRCLYEGGKALPDKGSQVIFDAMHHCTRAHFRLPGGVSVITTSTCECGHDKSQHDSLGSGISGRRGIIRPNSAGNMPSTIDSGEHNRLRHSDQTLNSSPSQGQTSPTDKSNFKTSLLRGSSHRGKSSGMDDDTISSPRRTPPSPGQESPLGMEDGNGSMGENPRSGTSVAICQVCSCQRFRPVTITSRSGGPRLIVSMGDYSAYAMTGTFDSTDWRGYVKPYIGNGYQEREEPWVPGAQDIPVLITMHIARLFREPEYTLATRHDWSKIQRILRRTWPVRPPTFAECPPSPWPQRFAFDTEFNPSTYDGDTSLVRYSMSWGVHDEQTCVVEEEDIKTPLVAGRLTVVTQSAPADIYRLAKVVGIPARDVWTTFRIHDTIVKHAVLHPDHPHDLNYLGSIYASINRWKHLADDHPQLYAGCDAFGTLEVDNALERELDADPRSRWIYENVDGPAHRIFVDAQRRGVRTDPERITEVVGVLETATQDAQAHARAAVGWPINLGSSQQVGHQLYTVEGIKKPRGYK